MHFRYLLITNYYPLLTLIVLRPTKLLASQCGEDVGYQGPFQHLFFTIPYTTK